MEIHQIGVMETLIRECNCSGSIKGFKFAPKSINLVDGSKLEYPNSDPEFSPNPNNSVESPDSGTNSGLDSHDDPTDAGLKYITQMLMEEEDLEHQPCMFQDCLALQAAEKSFYDVIGQTYPPTLNIKQYPLCFNGDFDGPNGYFTSSNDSSSGDVESDWFSGVDKFEPPSVTPYEYGNSERGDLNLARFCRHDDGRELDKVVVETEKHGRDHSPSGSGGKRNYYLDDNDYVNGGRNNKQIAANYVEESDEQSVMYDKVLLCANLNPHLHHSPDDDPSNNRAQVQVRKSSGGRPRKKQGNQKEVIDLSTLLTQCAQAVSTNDGRTANDLLKRIRQHSSAHGDGSERLAHYLAKALEQRLAGYGTGVPFMSSRISARDVLKGYQVYIQACPFKKLTNFYANRTICKLSRRSSRLHIIDFGILYGFQWPCLIQILSMAPGGPPKLRITGIELPQPGLRPAERIEETGRRLKKYCERFNVPFEYTAIAKKWDTVQLDDIKFEKDEVLVVNCLHRLKNVPDDTVVASNPRDTVLNLIRRINPDLFVHAVVNGTYNAPFFLTRFRETFFCYSAMFDMFDSTINREDQNRMMYEREVFGKDMMNVIACEGTERVERPETYKQWQARNLRAGFKQVALDREIVGEVRDRVRLRYHNDFVVDEDGKWMLQGWKGRIICGISCWKPAR